MSREITAGRIKAARIIAVAADLIQLALFPVTIEGAISPVDDGLDVLVAGIMVYLLGFHWAFLPSFAAKLVPVADMIPTWTLSVMIATRNGPANPAGDAAAAATPDNAGKITDIDVKK
jgi:hypothetical protein